MGRGTMMDTNKEFEAFLIQWKKENVGPLGDHTDPGDVVFLAQRLSADLSALAHEKGFHIPLVEMTRPYGGVIEFIKMLFDRADFQAILRGGRR
jgi:hypothetical protein